MKEGSYRSHIESSLAHGWLGGWMLGIGVLVAGLAFSALFLRQDPLGPQLMVLFFPGLGVWLLYRMAQASRSVRRYGIARLFLSEAPRLGVPMRGWIRFDKGIGTTFCELRLRCTRLDTSDDSALEILLEEERRAIADGDGHIAFSFDLPPDLPISGKRCKWKLSVSPEEHGFDQTFELDVGEAQGEIVTAPQGVRSPRPIDYERAKQVKRLIAVAIVISVIPFAWTFFHTVREGQDSVPSIEATAEVWQRAVDADRLADLKAIAAKGFDVDTRTESGATALMLAGVNGRLETARWLVEQGADVNSRHLSTNPKDKGTTPLIMAGFGGNVELVELLLDAGAQPQTPDGVGRTSLHAAAWSGCVECIRKLYARGETLDHKAIGNRGETPLMIAASRNQIAAMETLIELGADPKAKDSHGKTPYDWAEFYKQNEAMAWLRARR